MRYSISSLNAVLLNMLLLRRHSLPCPVIDAGSPHDDCGVYYVVTCQVNTIVGQNLATGVDVDLQATVTPGSEQKEAEMRRVCDC